MINIGDWVMAEYIEGQEWKRGQVADIREDGVMSIEFDHARGIFDVSPDKVRILRERNCRICGDPTMILYGDTAVHLKCLQEEQAGPMEETL